MSEEDDAIAQLKKDVRNAESQVAYYRKRHNAFAAPPSIIPYLKLATIYRKQKNYQAEVVRWSGLSRQKKGWFKVDSWVAVGGRCGA